MNDSNIEFVIGIDFGTTYSGVSYAKTNVEINNGKFHDSDIIDIRNWNPSTNHLVQAKTEAIYINNELKTYGGRKLTAALQKAAKSSTTITHVSLFKLYLDEHRPMDLPPLPPGLTVTDVISDYLKKMYEHTVSEMQRSLGEYLVKKEYMRFCVTVPAVWTERAKIMMREAVLKAGIEQDRLMLVSEPEAAALYCAKFLKGDILKHGDRFMMCDAGGGTVDLITYELNDDQSGRYLIEVVEGDGGVCGSVYLDQQFRQFVDEYMGRMGVQFTEKEINDIVETFRENTKLGIQHPNDREYDGDHRSIGLPYAYSDIDMEEGPIYISDGQLNIAPMLIIQQVFEPVTRKVLELVELQMKRASRHVDALFLVGGFGQSKYLFEELKEQYDKEIRIIAAPYRGELAIARGAVLMGLAPTYVRKRVIRRTYGYQIAKEFEEGVDPEEYAFTRSGTKWCEKRFEVFAKKGDTQSIEYFATRRFRSDYTDDDKHLSLYAYDGDIDKIPRYTSDLDIKNILRFRIQVPRLDKQHGDEIEINVKFFLYQTEIKIEVDIEGHIQVYTGSYPKQEPPLLATEKVAVHQEDPIVVVAQLEQLDIQGYS